MGNIKTKIDEYINLVEKYIDIVENDKIYMEYKQLYCNNKQQIHILLNYSSNYNSWHEECQCIED